MANQKEERETPTAADERTERQAAGNTEERARLSVVGVGASAGGLTPLRTFLSALPPDTGLTFVVVTHLSPQHESILADLLQPHTPMPVQQVTERVEMQPDHVYVIPPGKRLLVMEDHLELAEFDMPRGQRLQIDAFFRSLAEHHGDGGAVILSGSGSDGAVGIQHIKEGGGLILVQDPAEAEYDGMPKSAIATGLVDVVAPVAELAVQLVAAKQTGRTLELPADPSALSATAEGTLLHLLAHLRVRTGHDFSGYKRATILRRIGRRMQVTQLPTLTAYLHRLRQDAEETDALNRDLLIHVTEFFRDPEAWETLAQEIVPQLFTGKGVDDQVRVWTVGCATGEEAYGIAMLLLEHAGTMPQPPQIQVFASDLGDIALDYARRGIYPEAIAANVSAERLDRFFTQDDSHYRVRDDLRERVLFTPHNLLQDPPFSKLDLVLCRNLLIYLQRPLQERAFETFHYALQPQGVLFLGSAESPDSITTLFEPVHKQHHIYRRSRQSQGTLVLPTLPRQPHHNLSSQPQQGTSTRGTLHEAAPGQPWLGESVAPPSLLVDVDYHVRQLSETAGRYLLPPAGALTFDVLRLVRPELQSELRAALFRAVENGKATLTRPVPVRFNGAPHPVAMLVRPVRNGQGHGQALIFFLEDETPVAAGAATDDATPTASPQGLQAELGQAQRQMQALREEYETTVEELRSSNEELQSTNEEYRSTLEELETSKEELQSVNEELQTVNTELRSKVEETSRSNSDLHNLLAATEIATLFLDRELKIKRYTPRAVDLFNLMPPDQGRPIGHLRTNLHYEQLEDDARKVLRNLTPIEREVEDAEGRWYQTNVRPYRTPDDRIDGVVITFVDVTINKRNELALQAAKEYAESIVHTIPDALLVLETDLRVRSANDTFYEMFAVKRVETQGELIYTLGNGQWDIPELRQLLEEILPENKVFFGYEVDHEFESIGRRVMLLNGRRLDHVQLILLAITDITERKRAEEALREREERQAFLLKLSDALRAQPDEQSIKDQTVKMLAEHLRLDRCYISEVFKQEGYSTVGPEHLRLDLPPMAGVYRLSDYPETMRQLATQPMVINDAATDPRFSESEKALLADLPQRALLVAPLRKGPRQVIWALAGAMATPRRWTEGERVLLEEVAERTWAAVERAKAEAALRESEEQLRRVLEGMGEGFGLLAPDFTILEHNREALRLDGRASEEVVGRSHWDVYPGSEASEVGRLLKKAMAERVPVSLEHCYTFEEGRARWLDMRAYPVADGSLAVFWSDVTERRESQDALRASEERFRTVADLVPDLLWRSDTNGDTTWLNQRWLNYTGQTLEEAAGWGWTEAIHPEDRQRSTENYRRAAETGDPLVQEHRIRRHDGTFRWFLIRAEPVRNEAGVVQHWFGSATDIHDQRTAAEALRESEARRLLAVEAAGVADWTYRAATGTLTFLSPRGYEMHRIKPSEPLSVEEHDRLIHPEDRAAVQTLRNAALDPATADDRYRAEFRLRFDDGELRWFESCGQARFEETGDGRQPLALLGVMIDITERKQAEEALRESEEQFRLFGEAASEVLWIRSADTLQWKYLSPAFEPIYGRARAAALEGDDLQRWAEFIVPEDREHALAQMERVRAGEHVTYEYRIRQPGGAVRWLRDTDFPIRDAAGRIRHVGGIGQDVTEEKQAEAALRQLNETLEERVAHRSQQVRTLVTQLAMSEQEERQRISQVLHDDLQQRLYAIQFQFINLRTALEDPLDSTTQEEALDMLTQAEAQLAASIAQTRSLSVDLSPPVLAGEGLDIALEWLATQMEQQHGLSVQVQSADRLPALTPNLRILLFQTIRELLFNIVKHAGVSEAVVTLRHTDDELHIEVIDQGTGFDAATILGDPERSHGLRQNQQRLELVGGQMQFESSPEGGTRVLITCPLPRERG